MNRQLEIAIVLFSETGREIRLREIPSGRYYLEENEMTPDFFWGATGGFEVITEGYKSIFRGFDFYVSLKAIDFLLHSLLWVNGDEGDYDIDEEYPDSLVSRFQDGSFIRLSRADQITLEFSYLAGPNEVSENEGKGLFAGEFFTVPDWVSAVKKAMDGYFKIIESILIHEESKHAAVLKDYLTLWNRLQ